MHARAMMRELTESYGVTRRSAIAKRTNLRSIRMLERLGFSLAAPEAHAVSRAEPDEVLMALVIEGPC
jgi:RimJ/RimL family protein N-acetyltransferase